MERIFVTVMKEALISIGSNSDREANLTRCQELLNATFADVVYSSTSITTPYGANYRNDFMNQLAIIRTDGSKEEIISLLKQFEKEIGRKSDDKDSGYVVIDIDLVVWSNEVLKPQDMNRDYVKKLITSLPLAWQEFYLSRIA